MTDNTCTAEDTNGDKSQSRRRNGKKRDRRRNDDDEDGSSGDTATTGSRVSSSPAEAGSESSFHGYSRAARRVGRSLLRALAGLVDPSIRRRIAATAARSRSASTSAASTSPSSVWFTLTNCSNQVKHYCLSLPPEIPQQSSQTCPSNATILLTDDVLIRFLTEKMRPRRGALSQVRRTIEAGRVSTAAMKPRFCCYKDPGERDCLLSTKMGVK